MQKNISKCAVQKNTLLLLYSFYKRKYLYAKDS